MMKFMWKYADQALVAPQAEHVIAGIKELDYDELVKSILSSAEQSTTEWINNMQVN